MTDFALPFPPHEPAIRRQQPQATRLRSRLLPLGRFPLCEVIKLRRRRDAWAFDNVPICRWVSLGVITNRNMKGHGGPRQLPVELDTINVQFPSETWNLQSTERASLRVNRSLRQEALLLRASPHWACRLPQSSRHENISCEAT
eukprot:scaffold280718_cov33-Tisochrysis_lutea.AAC.3